MGETRNSYNILVGNLYGRHRPICENMSNIKMTITETDLRCELDLSGYREVTMTHFCEYDDEPLSSVKAGKFLTS
jgi:hypothetical protein